jgi:hypothetical protein
VPHGAPSARTLVTPDLIAEVIRNGTLAPHFAWLYQPLHDPSHRPKALEVEVEVSCMLFTIPVPVVEGHPAAAAPLPQHRPLLLRTFRRHSGPAATNHCLQGGNQPLDDWAPPAVLHAVKALQLCGVTLSGPVVTHQVGIAIGPSRAAGARLPRRCTARATAGTTSVSVGRPSWRPPPVRPAATGRPSTS